MTGEERSAFLLEKPRTAGRYMGEELAEDYGRRNSVEGELLLRVHPTNVGARRNVAD